MLYMMGVRLDESVPHPPHDEFMASVERVGRINKEMEAAGVWVFGGGLAPSDSSTVVRVQDGATTVTDGPYVETKEQLGGFWVIRVPDLDAALVWAERCSEACGQPLELRPFDDISQD